MTEHERTAGMSDECLKEIVAGAMEQRMFAPHELPVDPEVHARNLATAEHVIAELAAKALPDEDALVEAMVAPIAGAIAAENCTSDCEYPDCGCAEGERGKAEGVAQEALSAIRPHLAALQARAEAAEAEVERLREALEKIGGQKGRYSMPFPERQGGYGSFAVMTARDALAAKS